MIRGLLFAAYLIIRFLAGDLRLGWWKWQESHNRRVGFELRPAVSAFMRREAARIINSAHSLSGFSVVTESALNEPLPPVFVLVSNHQSLLDIPVLMTSMPKQTFKFIAKRSLKYGVLLISKCMRYGGDALIIRPRIGAEAKHIRLLLRELRRFADLIDEGCSPVIFAEGTRSRDGEVHQFHAGGLASVLAGRAVPIVTVAIDGGFRLRGVSGIARLGRTRYRVKLLSVHSPPGNKAELRMLTERMRIEISEQIKRWRRLSPVRSRRSPSDGSPHQT